MKTTKQDKIERLTKKYFWGQKIKEVVIGFICLITPYFLGLAVQQIFSIPGSAGPVSYWLLGFLFVILLLMSASAIYIVYMLIKCCLDSNWQKAKERAEEEVR